MSAIPTDIFQTKYQFYFGDVKQHGRSKKNTIKNKFCPR